MKDLSHPVLVEVCTSRAMTGTVLPPAEDCTTRARQ
jgi:hypothetical protein